MMAANQGGTGAHSDLSHQGSLEPKLPIYDTVARANCIRIRKIIF